MYKDIDLSALKCVSGDDDLVPVYSVINTGRPTIHRFYDSSPISPSGFYIVVTEFPYENRLPDPGDYATVVVIELKSGEIIYSDTTAAWDTQVGAHAQWGASDDVLLYNKMDVTDWQPFGVMANIFSREKIVLSGTVYSISPDGRYSASPSLNKLSIVQPGYGVTLPDVEIKPNKGVSDDDGLFVTDLLSNDTHLAVSFKKIFNTFRDEFGDIDPESSAMYGFHTKWSPDGSKIAFIVRIKAHSARQNKSKNFLVTYDTVEGRLYMSLKADRWKGGHHPNWCPDSQSFVMNLRDEYKPTLISKISVLVEKVAKKFGVRFYSKYNKIWFYEIKFDGTSIKKLSKQHSGSGHPTLHSAGRFLVSDAYNYEIVAFDDGSIPIRAIYFDNDDCKTVLKLRTTPRFYGPHGEYRIDPHPAWDRSGRYLVMNTAVNGVRGVVIADMGSVL